MMHSGETSDFRIECDALTDGEIKTFAMLISRRFQFKGVSGIPRGGSRIAIALEQFRDPKQSRWMIVDDVLTTGDSMNRYRLTSSDIGVVLFARGPCPDWVHPVFQLWGA